MEKVFQTIENLKSMIRVLVGERKILRDKNRELRQDLKILKTELEQVRGKLAEKEEELRITNLTGALKGQQDTSRLKLQIDQMIKDIEKNIAILSGSK